MTADEHKIIEEAIGDKFRSAEGKNKILFTRCMTGKKKAVTVRARQGKLSPLLDRD